MLKAVIFDFDGTVCDTLPLCLVAFKAAVGPIWGREPSMEELIAAFGPSEEGTIRALVPDAYDRGISEYFRVYAERHGELCPAPFPGIVETIAELRSRGVKTALVTGKGAAGLALSMDYLGLSGLFDETETGSPEGQRKADGIRTVLAAMGILPNDFCATEFCVTEFCMNQAEFEQAEFEQAKFTQAKFPAAYIGDAPSDARFAREAGVTPLSALWGSIVFADEVAAERPEAVFRTVAEFRAWVMGRV
ncbi:MAG: HAD family hydrolase [Clostridiales bacterium]|jgi:phosphoglycolate phosphatase/pyrophosphatase PpaX|nr:HAD family hydrolase [Clostridiales bacterium]